MTPTLYGRWQTRFLLITLLGGPITAIFALWFQSGWVPFILLGYVLLFGFGWDFVYNYVQTWRWNRDWPPLFSLYAGLWEGCVLFVLTQLPALTLAPPRVSLLIGIPFGGNIGVFWLHYGLVFGASFFCSLGLIHVVMPHWRYQGGQWM